MLRRLVGWLFVVGGCLLAAFHTTSVYAAEQTTKITTIITTAATTTTITTTITTYIGATPDSSTVPWTVTDCHDPWNKRASSAATLRADCNLRFNGPHVRYAYPKIEWRTFGATTVTLEENHEGKNNALGDLRAEVLAPVDAQKEWTPKIVYSGDVSAIDIFSDVLAVTPAAPATIGGIDVNAENKQQVQVHTRRINRIGKAPIIMALYDQYDGHLYLHAFKSRRTTGKHVEVLHARLSPLHLGFLRGASSNNHFSDKFYKDAEPYLFDDIDFAGAITAAGQLARHLHADLVVFYVPTIDIALIRRRIINTIRDKTESTDIYTRVYPKWFYGIPQTTGGGGGVNINIGFTGAICGVKNEASIDARDCDVKHFLPSYLAMMKVSEFSVADKIKKMSDFLINSSGATLSLYSVPLSGATLSLYSVPLYSVPVGDITEADGGRLLTGGTQPGFFQVLQSMRTNNILAEDFSGNNDFFTGASYVAEEKTVFLNKIIAVSATLSNGSLTSTLSYSNQGLAELSVISQDLVGKIGTKDVGEVGGTGAVADDGWESVRNLYQGNCASDISRADCGVDATVGIVPRPDDFVPRAGGNLVAPYLLSTQKGRDALKEARK